MNIMPISEILGPAGLNVPTLNVLLPNTNNYKVILFQPQGTIDATADGVRNRHRELAKAQFGTFLDEAVNRNADLTIVPEYSLPWEILVNAIKSGKRPSVHGLWALGCESLRYSELEALKAELDGAATVLFETLEPDANRFLDPLVYVFRSPSATTGEERIVILVQFKTTAMGDGQHYEVNNLQLGTRIYVFGANGRIRLVSLICSDVFGLTDADAEAIYDRSLIIHIQLNPKPRHEAYRHYRDKLLKFHGDETELICLNWAKDVAEWSGDKQKDWKNIAASAWYLRPDKFDSADDTLGKNHKRGLYYTWLKTLRYHTLFFNYQPAVFVVEASKVAHLNVTAALSHRRGPQLSAVLSWDNSSATWVEQQTSDDGFLEITPESGGAKENIEQLSAKNPLFVERLLALSAGQIGPDPQWHRLQHVDSCAIDASEVIKRMTFCQDTDPLAAQFRISRLKLCGRLSAILSDAAGLPPPLNDFANGFLLDWSPEMPHRNARTVQGGPATVLYMGEQVSKSEVEEASKRLAEFLRRGSNIYEGIAARQRLAVWFQEDGQIKLFDAHRYVQIDKSSSESEFDIGRSS